MWDDTNGRMGLQILLKSENFRAESNYSSYILTRYGEFIITYNISILHTHYNWCTYSILVFQILLVGRLHKQTGLLVIYPLRSGYLGL